MIGDVTADRLLSRFSPKIIVWLIYLIWSLCLTYPLVRVPFSHIPLGSETAGTVPNFNLWTLQRNIDQLMAGYPNYWDAPIFFPTTGTFSFSDPQPLTALLAAPVWLGLSSAAAGYNAVLILFVTLNGWFTFWLLKHWWLSTPVALLAGLIMQSLPFLTQEMGVIQLLATFGLLWSLLFLSRFLQECRCCIQRWSTIIGLALGTIVTFLTSSYYGLFSLFVLPLAFIFIAAEEFQRRKTRSYALVTIKQCLGSLLLVGILVIIVAGPFLWMQRGELAAHNFSRSTDTIERGSAQISDYTYALDYNLLYGQVLGASNSARQRLFPGFGLATLALMGLSGQTRRWTKYYLLLLVLLAFLLSLGLKFEIFGWSPYRIVHQVIPGSEYLRSPFRFATLVQMGLALLAGFGLANLQAWLGRQGTLISIVVAALIIIESLAWPLPLHHLPMLQKNTAWQTWLSQQPQPAAVVMVPFAPSTRVGSFEQTSVWMLESRYFQGHMANGYSGFFPAYHAQLRRSMQDFPSEESINLLRSLGVEYVLNHTRRTGSPRDGTVSRFLPLLYRDEINGVSIYRLDGEAP